jgi:hypothetical protein
MKTGSIDKKAREVILQDAIQRDLPTARRAALLELLWHERYLTREQLIKRIETKLERFCFGKTAWEDNFYRDMRVIKEAFTAAGLHLAFSRTKHAKGYYLRDQPALSSELRQIIKSSAAEVDPSQISIYHRLTPADRFRQGCALSDTARQVVAFRILQDHPGMTQVEANRTALQRAYAP